MLLSEFRTPDLNSLHFFIKLINQLYIWFGIGNGYIWNIWSTPQSPSTRHFVTKIKHISIKQINLLLALWCSLRISNIFRIISCWSILATRQKQVIYFLKRLHWHILPFHRAQDRRTQDFLKRVRLHILILLSIHSKTSLSLTCRIIVTNFLQLLLF